MSRAWGLRAALACGLGLGAAAPLATQPATVVSRIEPGLWQLQAEDGTSRDLCVADPARLFQVRHEGTACTRLPLASDATSATVHYSCPGAGWGRTTITVSTPRSIKIDTQGIADNAPFAFAVEARRTGDCPRSAANAASVKQGFNMSVR